MNIKPRSSVSNFFSHILTMRHFLTKRRYWIASMFALVGAFIALGAAVRRQADPKLPPTAAAIPVATMPIERVDSFDQVRTFTGVIKAARTSELGFERTGKLITVDVEEGDVVQQGQTLAELDSRNLDAKQRRLQAQRASANARLAELEAGPRKQTIEAARAEVGQMQSDLQLSQANHARNERLFRKNAVSRADFERTQFGTESAMARLEAARQRFNELEAGTRQEKIDAQKAFVAELDAALEDVAVDLEESRLVAPFDGTISKRHLDEGTIVAPGTPLLRIVETSQLEAWIGLPPSIAAKVEVGQQHRLRVDGQVRVAIISAILPELDAATRTRTVVLSFVDGSATASFVPSQVVRIETTEPTKMDGYWLPTDALTPGTRGLWSAYAVEHDAERNQHVVARRDVELIHSAGDRSFVRGTLAPTDRIIISGTHRIVAGQAVAVQSAHPTNENENEETAARTSRTHATAGVARLAK